MGLLTGVLVQPVASGSEGRHSGRDAARKCCFANPESRSTDKKKERIPKEREKPGVFAGLLLLLWSGGRTSITTVMPGLDPGIFFRERWIAGSSPAITPRMQNPGESAGFFV